MISVKTPAMTARTAELQRKIQIKTRLAEKHERLAAVASSTPKKNTWNFHARRFRNQAKALEQQLQHIS